MYKGQIFGGVVTMSKSDLIKTVKKAIILADALENAVKISHAIDDLSEGIEEIEKSLRLSKKNYSTKEYLRIDKNKK